MGIGTSKPISLSETAGLPRRALASPAPLPEARAFN